MVAYDNNVACVECEVVAIDVGDITFLGGIIHNIVDAVERYPERGGMIVIGRYPSVL